MPTRAGVQLLFPLIFFLSCADPLDGPGSVHDLRLLAMRADPPEQLLTNPGMIKVTALIANPAGGFLVGCTWTTCSEQDSATTRCLETSPGFKLLGESTAQTGPEGSEPSISFVPDGVLLKKIADADPFRGFGGIRQIVQVELRAGDERVVGFKRVVFSIPSMPPVKLNTNPVVGPVEFNDAGWLPEVPVQFTVAPPRMPARFMMGSGGAMQNQLAILEDKSLPEDYVVRTFEGESRVLHETFRYNFFATRGSFSPQTAGGNNLLFPDAGVEASWAPVAGEDAGSGPTTVWIVVRDGRGGENWVARHAVAP